MRAADCVPVPHDLVQAVQAEKAEKPPSTGQAWALQLRDLVASPAQSAPPLNGTGLVQVRAADCVPVPHDFEQVAQALKLVHAPSIALRPVGVQSPWNLKFLPLVWSNSIHKPVWCVGCLLVQAQVAPECVHLNDGCIMAWVYSTRVSPFGITKHLGASPALNTVAGAAATVPTRAVMAKELRIFRQQQGGFLEK